MLTAVCAIKMLGKLLFTYASHYVCQDVVTINQSKVYDVILLYTVQCYTTVFQHKKICTKWHSEYKGIFLLADRERGKFELTVLHSELSNKTSIPVLNRPRNTTIQNHHFYCTSHIHRPTARNRGIIKIIKTLTTTWLTLIIIIQHNEDMVAAQCYYCLLSLMQNANLWY